MKMWPFLTPFVRTGPSQPQNRISGMGDRPIKPDLAAASIFSDGNSDCVFVDVQSNVSNFVHSRFPFELLRVRQETTLAARAPQNAHLV